MSASAASSPISEPAPPQAIHNCPNCSHWLNDGVLVCPDCQTIVYGQHLGLIAEQAQQLEREQRWADARTMWRNALQWLPAETGQAARIQQHIAQLEQRLAADEAKKAKWTKRLGPFAPILVFLAKFKSAFFLLFKLKALLSLLAFFGIYWAIFGWKFAAGFTASIFIHEMGHYITARRAGFKTQMPIFLPGFGAYVRYWHNGAPLETLVRIAAAGPMFGLLSALACFGLWYPTHSLLLLVLANLCAWYNLLNLIPVFGLDGSMVTYGLSMLQRGLILITCVVFFALTYAGELFDPRNHWVFLLVAAGMLWRLFQRDVPEKPSTYGFAAFQGLVVALGMLIVVTQGMISARIPDYFGR